MMSKFLEDKDYFILINELRKRNDPVERRAFLKYLDKSHSELNSNFRHSLLKCLNILISEDEYKFCRVVDLNPQMTYEQIAQGAYPYQYYLEIRKDIISLDNSNREQGIEESTQPSNRTKALAIRWMQQYGDYPPFDDRKKTQAIKKLTAQKDWSFKNFQEAYNGLHHSIDKLIDSNKQLLLSHDLRGILEDFKAVKSIERLDQLTEK